MGIAAVLDKAGPALASGIILAVLGAGATSAMAWRDLSSASAVRFGTIAAELERLRTDLEAFRSPGGRFTYHDGERHWQRMDGLEVRIREQEMRPPRLNPALDTVTKDVADIENRLATLTEKLRHIEAEQERLCARLQACKGNNR